jgi:hypothetical protein
MELAYIRGVRKSPALLVLIALIFGMCAGAGNAASRSPTGGLSATGGRVNGGPLEPSSVHGSAISFPRGQRFTDGLEVLELKGDQPARIDAIQAVGLHGLRALGSLVAGPKRHIGAIQFARSYPPRDPALKRVRVQPAVGAMLPPYSETNHWGLELLLGYKAIGSGQLTRLGINIDYTIAGIHYRRFFPARLSICTSRAVYVDGTCPIYDPLA